MGATIGINSMILLGSFSYILGIDQLSESFRKKIITNFWICQASLFVFWICLIVAGILKGYRSITLNIKTFQEVMIPVMPVLKAFSWASHSHGHKPAYYRRHVHLQGRHNKGRNRIAAKY
jgi:nitric oxide reductase subunit B